MPGVEAFSGLKDDLSVPDETRKERLFMRKKNSLALAIALLLLPVSLTACGKSEFGVTTNTPEQMIITAENAGKDASFMVGSLEVSDGKQIVIASDLKKGEVRVEIVRMPDEQSADKLPEIDEEATLTANLKAGDGASGTVPAGTYMLKAICLEKATGTIQINVNEAS